MTGPKLIYSSLGPGNSSKRDASRANQGSSNKSGPNSNSAVWNTSNSNDNNDPGLQDGGRNGNSNRRSTQSSRRVVTLQQEDREMSDPPTPRKVMNTFVFVGNHD